MININVQNLKEVQKKFDTMLRRIENPKSEMEIIAGKAYKNVVQHFQNEEGKSGKWKGLAESSAKKRRPGMSQKKAAIKGIKSAVKLLQDTGRLRNSLRWRTLTNEIHVYTQIIYAAVHNFGYNKRNITQREFLWLDQQTIKSIYKSIVNFIKLNK